MSLGFLTAIVVAEIVGVVAGFGSSTVLLPVAILFFDFRVALVIVAIVHVMGNLLKAGWFGRKLSGKLLWWFGIPSVVGSVFGARLVNLVDAVLLTKLLGGFLVVYGIGGLLGREVRVKGKNWVLGIGGITSGLLAGLIGTGGALRGAFLSAYGVVKEKEKYIATMAVIAILVDVTRIPIYVSLGYMPRDFWVYLLPMALLAVVGVVLGRWIVKRESNETFRKLVLVALVVGGVWLMTK